jgi:hypothetical protein
MGSVAIPQGATLQPLQAGSAAVPIPQGATLQALPQPGEQINDVGNRVIVPKEGESFSDTMNRAAVYGKTVTQGQINAEVQTMPGKVATVLGAAPVIGAAGAAGLAGAGALIAPTAARTLFETQGPSLLRRGAVAGAAALVPIAKKYGIKALEGAGLGAGWDLYKELKQVFEGPG